MSSVAFEVPPAELDVGPPGWSWGECQALWHELQDALDTRRLPPDHPAAVRACKGPFRNAHEAAVRRDLPGVRKAVADGLAELLTYPVGTYRSGSRN